MTVYHAFMAIFKHQIYSNLIMYKYLPHICYKQTKKSCFFAVKLIFKQSQCIFFDPRKFLNQPTTASTYPYSTDIYYKNIPKAEFYFLLIVCINLFNIYTQFLLIIPSSITSSAYLHILVLQEHAHPHLYSAHFPLQVLSPDFQ